MSALAATALALVLAPLAAEARDKPKPAETKAQAAKQVPAAPVRATAEERAMVGRLDPLARAAFWGREADRDGRDVEASVNLSQALRQLGRFDDAGTAAQRAMVVAPDSVPALLEFARVQIGRGQGFYAIDPARRALALAPRDWRAASLLGVAYEQAERNDEALAAHRQAVSLAPAEPAALTNLAMFYAGHGDTQQAETLLRQAAAKPGASMTVRQNLALVLGLQGRLDEAERIVRQDLPPEVVANNMAYLRAAAANGSAVNGRSWDSLRSAQ
jgi:Flp pilus assembly protein TadD